MPAAEAEQLAVLADLGYAFCLRFLGRPWMTYNQQADSAGEAAAWVQRLTDWLNARLASQGYPPGAVTWTYGACS